MSKIMINRKKIRALLKKTENKFISIHTVSQRLKLNGKKALEVLTDLEAQGFIEKLEIEGFWVLSIRGKLLVNKNFEKEFKLETLKKSLDNLIERARIVNSSKEFPEFITCMKMTSKYPIEHQSSGISIAYSLSTKKITREEYEIAADKLRKRSKKTFGNYIEYLDYPSEAIRAFLKSRSHVLKLRKYENDEIKQIEGYTIIDENQHII